jgi:soluble lytic murein transglycosylase
MDCMDSEETAQPADTELESGHRSKGAHWGRRVLLTGFFLGALLLALFFQWRVSRERSQDNAILAASVRYNIHPALVKAVVWRESSFDPKARGTSGEFGLMQIRGPTGQDWASAEKNNQFTPTELLDPVKNTQCGAWYLRRLLNRYRNTDNPLVYALAAYNAGPANVNRWSKGEGATNSAVMLRQMDFPGTRRYVASVARRYEYYRKSFPPKSWRQDDRPSLIDPRRVQSRVSAFSRFSMS